MEYPCSICGEESDKHPYDIKAPIFCTKCDPKSKCILCENPRSRPAGQSEYCDDCSKKVREANRITNRGYSPMIIDNTKVEGTQMNRSSYKRLNSRVVGDSGETLSGDKGLSYMKEHAKTNPGYASRLKDYLR